MIFTIGTRSDSILKPSLFFVNYHDFFQNYIYCHSSVLIDPPNQKRMTESEGSTNQNSQSKISTTPVLKNGIKNSLESSDDVKSNSISHKQSNGSTQCKLISSLSADRDIEKKNSSSSHSPFTINIQIDIVAWSCFLIAFLFRVYLIGYPPNIVYVQFTS